MRDATSDVSGSSSVAVQLDLARSKLEAAARVIEGDRVLIAALRAQVDAQATIIGDQTRSLAHSRKIFDLAAAAARIGVWECRLEDEALTWTDGVYRIFDLPAGSFVDRRMTLGCYSPDSRRQLEKIRSRAIEERGGFTFDAQIVTGLGNRRWVRLTATVECERGVPVRIFGMKQDITEEKLLSDRTRYLAEIDPLTGLANRSVFQSRLAAMGRNCTLLLIDLDGFKGVNDTHGHAGGDACLTEVGRRLKTTIRDTGFVARIGGDEFGIILTGAGGTEEPAILAERIVETLSRPIVWEDRVFNIGASVGVATLSHSSVEETFLRADTALYAAKAAGRGSSGSRHPDTASRDRLTPRLRAGSVLPPRPECGNGSGRPSSEGALRDGRR